LISENEISILFANRSAVLYHQTQYDAALLEIERAIEMNYPKNLMYKLKERKARCMLAKKNNEEALKAFKEDVQALDDSNLPEEKFKKLEKDAQIMIKMLTKTIEMESRMKKPLQKKKADVKVKEDVKDFVNREVLSFDETEEEGRFAKAATDIKLGTYLVQEKPHVSCLLQSYSQTHCQTCFKRCNIPIACTRCSDVIFCSKKCLNDAMNTFHKYECGTMQHLWNSGISITCQMALRIIAQKSVKYFLDIKNELDMLRDKVDYTKIDTLSNDDYRRVFVLVTHEKDRTFEDIFHRMTMSSFLTYCLKIGGFFEDDSSDER
jgi:SET and MYND domain-containing protein 4